MQNLQFKVKCAQNSKKLKYVLSKGNVPLEPGSKKKILYK